MSIDIKTQRELSEFVSRVVYCNQTMLVEAMLDKGMTDYENILNLYQDCDDCQGCATAGDECLEQEPKEIFEWWLVSDWLLKKLERHGEPILKTDWGGWWGRTCTGQAISLDGVIEDIYMDL